MESILRALSISLFLLSMERRSKEVFSVLQKNIILQSNQTLFLYCHVFPSSPKVKIYTTNQQVFLEKNNKNPTKHPKPHKNIKTTTKYKQITNTKTPNYNSNNNKKPNKKTPTTHPKTPTQTKQRNKKTHQTNRKIPAHSFTRQKEKQVPERKKQQGSRDSALNHLIYISKATSIKM